MRGQTRAIADKIRNFAMSDAASAAALETSEVEQMAPFMKHLS